jgi:hypothetical protein
VAHAQQAKAGMLGVEVSQTLLAAANDVID